MPSDAEIQAAINDYAREITRRIEREIMNTFRPNLGAIPPTEHSTASEVWARMERSNRVHPENPQRYHPFMLRRSDVKSLASKSRIGICFVNGYKAFRTFLSMGVVKHCDESVNWDHQAMERGENWATRGLPWQSRVPW